MTPFSQRAHAQRRSARRAHARRGSTLLEQVLVVTIVGIGVALATVGAVRLLDAAHVHAAARDVAAMFTLARDRAMATDEPAAVRLDAMHQQVRVHVTSDTVAVLDLRARGVTLLTTRDSMTYTSNGLGFGAANLRVILARGRSQDTITVSRLGRVKR